MDFLIVTQVILALLLSASIVFQKKSVGFSGALGGASMEENKAFYGNKRGLQKFLHQASIALAVLFFLNALLFVVV